MTAAVSMTAAGSDGEGAAADTTMAGRAGVVAADVVGGGEEVPNAAACDSTLSGWRVNGLLALTGASVV